MYIPGLIFARNARWAAIAVTAWIVSNALADPLPEGRSGLAAKYAGDANIESHPSVVFVERFDQAELKQTLKRWDETKYADGMRLTREGVRGAAEDQCLRITHFGGDGTGSHLYRQLLPGYDLLYARFYVKFDPDCAEIHHFGTHLGGFNPATRWPQGGAGERPDGTKRFTSGVEPYGKSWKWDFYSYWQGMHQHGDGRYWGTPFHAKAERPAVEKGKWICVEMMMKMNEPIGASNGEQAFWIDGNLFREGGQVTSHIGPGFPNGQWMGGWWHPDAKANRAFEGFRWRSTEKLNINYLWTYLYMTRAPKGHQSVVWFDNIVVATEYIGPITP